MPAHPSHEHDPEGRRLPFKIDSATNGEYEPRPLTSFERNVRRAAHERVDVAAKYVGLDRRSFLKSSMGVAAVLLTMNQACRDSGRDGGGFDVSGDAEHDPDAAGATLGKRDDEFIFDIQTHCVDPSGDWAQGPDGKRWQRNLTQVFGQASKCGDGSFECYSARQLIKDVFLDSDTDAAVVSALWGARGSNPTPTEYAAEARAVVEEMGGRGRAMIHGGVLPNEKGALDFMSTQVKEFAVDAWKLYPQWGPEGVGFFMDDERYGLPFLERARDLDVRTVCIHKGVPLPGLEYRYSDPSDMGPVAVKYDDLTFVIYHSGFESGVSEGPYNPQKPQGVDRLIKSFQGAGLERNKGNLYAELGSVWRYFMTKPDQAAHLLGKLFKYMGEDRICWGTDSLWYGSPQDQIQAFRTFQISPALRKQFGYPEITPEMRAKVFGLNAAKIYGVNVSDVRRLSTTDFPGKLKAAYRDEANPSFATHGPQTRREFLQLWRDRGGRPG